MTTLVVREVLPGATETALSLPSSLSETEWEAIGECLGQMNRASCWWIGDWINYGEDAGFLVHDDAGRFQRNEKYDRAEELTGLARGTLYVYAHVARSYPVLIRDKTASFKAHRLALGSANGGTPQLPPPFEITTERHRQMAHAAKERIERAVGSCNALARADELLQVERAVAITDPEELRGWDDAFAEAITALRKLRARIKEVRHA